MRNAVRLDKYLKDSGLAASRTEAAALIRSGAVTVDGKPALKPSLEVAGKDAGEIKVARPEVEFVGRGGIKLAAALDAFGISPEGAVAVDIGASTGGFTDCLLRRGAKRVYAVDCGSGQLHPALRSDPRVVLMENFNARRLTSQAIGEECQIAVMDVSFISQTLLFCGVKAVLAEGGALVSLIKPQFEAGREHIGKNGIVKSAAARRAAIILVLTEANTAGLRCGGLIKSPILGGGGNAEYLAFFRHDGRGGECGLSDILINTIETITEEA